jgi:hypothetical protein
VSPHPHHFDSEAESSIRIVPVARGMTCDNGARLFVIGVELWPHFSFVHYALLRVDEPSPGHLLPHPDLFSLEISMTDEFDHRYRPEGDARPFARLVGAGVFQRSARMFEPIGTEAKSLTIVPANATWKGWSVTNGEPGIVVNLPE